MKDGIAIVGKKEEHEKGIWGSGGNRAKCSFHQRRISVQNTTAKTKTVGNFAAIEALVFEIFLLTLSLNVTILGSRSDDV